MDKDGDELTVLRAQFAQAEARIRELELLADIDALTGVRNRRGFMRELERSAAYVRRYGGQAGLIFVDLDCFKPVNDAHGHAAGDAVLTCVAQALVRHVRASDIVGRLGGDEFVLLLWNVTGAQARVKAHEIEALLDALLVPYAGQTLRIAASAGAAALSGDVQAEQVLEEADAAMYRRKAERREALRR